MVKYNSKDHLPWSWGARGEQFRMKTSYICAPLKTIKFAVLSLLIRVNKKLSKIHAIFYVSLVSSKPEKNGIKIRVHLINTVCTISQTIAAVQQLLPYSKCILVWRVANFPNEKNFPCEIILWENFPMWNYIVSCLFQVALLHFFNLLKAKDIPNRYMCAVGGVWVLIGETSEQSESWKTVRCSINQT